MSDLESHERLPLIPVSKCTILVHPLRAAFYQTPEVGRQCSEDYFDRVLEVIPEKQGELLCIMPPEELQEIDGDQIMLLPDLSRSTSNSLVQFVDSLRLRGHEITTDTDVILGGLFLEFCVANTAINILRQTSLLSVSISKRLTFSAVNQYADDERFDVEAYLELSRVLPFAVTNEGNLFRLVKRGYLY